MNRIHLARLPMNGRVLIEWALRRRLLQPPPGKGNGRPRSAELGYAIHAALTQLFGTLAPRPFVHLADVSRHGYASSTIPAGPADMEILGYTKTAFDSLSPLDYIHAGALSSLIDWASVRSKPMPVRWPPGLCLRFDVRACPVRRIRRPLVTAGHQPTNRQVTTYSKGSEIDAYQIAVGRAMESGAPLPSREEAYLDWLKHRLANKNNAPEVVAVLTKSVRVISVNSVRVLRRSQGTRGNRSARWLTRPAVHFRGLLEIRKPEDFDEFLLQGIGRHCGFGFGMLLFKPA